MSKFGDAFASARKAGKKTFTWNGKSYTTQTKEEATKKAPTPKPASARPKSEAPKPRPAAERPGAKPTGTKAQALSRDGASRKAASQKKTDNTAAARRGRAAGMAGKAVDFFTKGPDISSLPIRKPAAQPKSTPLSRDGAARKATAQKKQDNTAKARRNRLGKVFGF